MDTKMDKSFKRLEDEFVQDKSSIKDKISSIENKISLTPDFLFINSDKYPPIVLGW